MSKSNPKRRNLSGIYIFDILEGEIKRRPTVFEDCTVEKQDEWLASLSVEALHNLAKGLGKSLRELGDHFDITSGSKEDDDE